MTILKRVVITSLLCCSPLNALELSIIPLFQYGYTSYQIGGNFTEVGKTPQRIHSPLSELKFPVNGPLIKAKVLHTFSSKKQTIMAQVYSDFADHSWGEMKDSDWGVEAYIEQNNAPKDRLEIFSKSKTSADFSGANLLFLTTISQTSRIQKQLGVGYRLNYFSFVCSDLNQEQLTPYTQALIGGGNKTLFIPGEVIAYKVLYQLPYVTASFKKITHHKDYSLSISLSPFARVTDEDDHILRSKRSTGQSSGSALWVESALTLKPSSKLHLQMGVAGFYLQTNGTQTQTQYKAFNGMSIGDIGTIDQHIIALQSSFFIVINLLY